MEEITLVLFLQDETYGKRMLHFLTGKKNPKLRLELITDREQIEEQLEMENVVVLTDDMSLQDERGKIWYLTGERNQRERSIYQYQKAEGIYTELWEMLGLDIVSVQEEKREVPGVYGVCSPDATCRTEYGAELSQKLAKQGKTLYLCLSAFPLYQREVSTVSPGGEKEEQGLSELLFYVQEESFPEKVRLWQRKFGEAYCFVPWKHVKDIWDIAENEWELFFIRLQKECGFDYVIVEIGEFFEAVWEVIRRCHQLYFLETSKREETEEQKVFLRYCQLEEIADIEKRVKWIRAGKEEEDDSTSKGFE